MNERATGMRRGLMAAALIGALLAPIALGATDPQAIPSPRSEGSGIPGAAPSPAPRSDGSVVAGSPPAPAPSPRPYVPPVTLCSQPVTFPQDVIALNLVPGTSLDIYAQPDTGPAATKIGTIISDSFGVATGVFPVTTDTNVTRDETITAFVAGTMTRVASYSHSLADFACPAGMPRPAGLLRMAVVQEPTAAECTNGGNNQWRELVDVVLANAGTSLSYAVSIQADDGTGGTITAGTFAVNVQGNGGTILPVVIGTTGGAPTSVAVSAVPIDGVPGSPSYGATATVATAKLYTVSCPS